MVLAPAIANSGLKFQYSSHLTFDSQSATIIIAT